MLLYNSIELDKVNLCCALCEHTYSIIFQNGHHLQMSRLPMQANVNDLSNRKFKFKIFALSEMKVRAY